MKLQQFWRRSLGAALLLTAVILWTARIVDAETLQACTNSKNFGGMLTAVATGDFDRDGNADLAVVDRSDSRVLVFLLKPDQLRANACEGLPSPNVVAVANPLALATGDIDRNNTLDLAVATNDGIAVLRGDGQGGFSPDSHLLSAGVDLRTVSIVDLDGDGRNDIVVGNGTTSSVTILYGTQTGFETAVDMTADGPVVALAVADLNKDGSLDIVVAASSVPNRATVFLQSPTQPRSFQRQSNSTMLGVATSALGVGDFDGDGTLDLSVFSGGPQGKLDIFQGQLSGGGGITYQQESPAPIPLMVLGNPNALVVTDFNRDSTLDVLSANLSEDTVSIFLNDLTGHLTEATLCGGGRCSVGSLPGGIAVADMNGDGQPDVVTANQSGTISLLLTGALLPTPSPTSTSTATATASPLPTGTQTPGGSCCDPHAGPSCDITSCQSCVCSILPTCCDASGSWDDRCVQLARGMTDPPITMCRVVCGCDTPTASATPTPTITRTPTITGTATITPTGPTATATVTPPPSVTPSVTVSPTITFLPTATASVSPTASRVPTTTMTVGPTSTATPECFTTGICVSGSSCAVDPSSVQAASGAFWWFVPAALGYAMRRRRGSR